MNILRTINVKLMVPIVILWCLIFLFLFYFVLHPVSDFMNKHIQKNMQWLASSTYSICDGNLDTLIRSGKLANHRAITIEKTRALRQIEDFFRQYEILGFIYHTNDRKIIWHNKLPLSVDSLIEQFEEYNQVVQTKIGGEVYSAYHFSFDPWQWHIVILQKRSHYETIVKRVSRAYAATAGILATSLLLILILFGIVIKRPINQIITPLKANRKPSYRGTVEFEFLSKNIEVMLESLHGAKIDLEKRVDERTHELRQANKALRKTKKALNRQAKELEKQVAKRTGEITSILRYTPSVVYMKDNSGKYLLVNSQYEKMFNVSNEMVRGKSDSDFLSKNMAEQFQENDERVLLDGRALNFEETITQDDGVHYYLSVKFPIFTGTGKIRGMCAILSDMTVAKNAHDRLRMLSTNIITNQENERKAIAREIHDELGQALTVLRMDAYWLNQKLNKENIDGADRAKAMCLLIDSIGENMHDLAIRLRPGILDDLGLEEALRWYTADYQRRTQIQCIFSCNEDPNISETLATATYRITQEALTNVARHAKATRVEVDLKCYETDLVLTICDNGQGFKDIQLADCKGLGLIGMRERAALVGGSLDVVSRVGHGTTICFKASLNHIPDTPQLTSYMV